MGVELVTRALAERLPPSLLAVLADELEKIAEAAKAQRSQQAKALVGAPAQSIVRRFNVN